MHYLVATDSVHTSAAACDYLEPRLQPGDAVELLTVVEPDEGDSAAGPVPGTHESGRDAGDATNVATARLAGTATVETTTRAGAPAETVRSVAAERDPDVVLVGTHGGRPGTGPGLGSVTRSVLEHTDRPVVVLPLPSLDG